MCAVSARAPLCRQRSESARQSNTSGRVVRVSCTLASCHAHPLRAIDEREVDIRARDRLPTSVSEQREFSPLSRWAERDAGAIAPKRHSIVSRQLLLTSPRRFYRWSRSISTRASIFLADRRNRESRAVHIFTSLSKQRRREEESRERGRVHEDRPHRSIATVILGCDLNSSRPETLGSRSRVISRRITCDYSSKCYEWCLMHAMNLLVFSDGDWSSWSTYERNNATMNVPIVAGDIVDDGGFNRPRFVRVSWYVYYYAAFILTEFHGLVILN